MARSLASYEREGVKHAKSNAQYACASPLEFSWLDARVSLDWIHTHSHVSFLCCCYLFIYLSNQLVLPLSHRLKLEPELALKLELPTYLDRLVDLRDRERERESWNWNWLCFWTTTTAAAAAALLLGGLLAGTSKTWEVFESAFRGIVVSFRLLALASSPSANVMLLARESSSLFLFASNAIAVSEKIDTRLPV